MVTTDVGAGVDQITLAIGGGATLRLELDPDFPAFSRATVALSGETTVLWDFEEAEDRSAELPDGRTLRVQIAPHPDRWGRRPVSVWVDGELVRSSVVRWSAVAFLAAAAAGTAGKWGFELGTAESYGFLGASVLLVLASLGLRATGR